MIDAFTKNTWLWFHILGGGILAKIALISGLSAQQAILAVLAIAIAWECYEYLSDDVVQVYGSYKRFLLDALGDIIGAIIMALVVVL